MPPLSYQMHLWFLSLVPGDLQKRTATKTRFFSCRDITDPANNLCLEDSSRQQRQRSDQWEFEMKGHWSQHLQLVLSRKTVRVSVFMDQSSVGGVSNLQIDRRLFSSTSPTSTLTRQWLICELWRPTVPTFVIYDLQNPFSSLFRKTYRNALWSKLRFWCFFDPADTQARNQTMIVCNTLLYGKENQEWRLH